VLDLLKGDRAAMAKLSEADLLKLLAAATSTVMSVDDAQREYAYGPAQGLGNTKVGTFTQELYDEAAKQGWTVVSMKTDWKRIFAFEP
jgi:hypothetical protein